MSYTEPTTTTTTLSLMAGDAAITFQFRGIPKDSSFPFVQLNDVSFVI